MAEVVQYHVEDLLKGFNVLELEGVFTNEEIQIIIKNIQNHEYKLQRTIKEKEINLKYINYLQSLLQLILKKYEKLNTSINEDVRHMLIKKIKTEFRKINEKNQRDIKIWFSFINFCKRNNHKDYVTKLYNRMLQVLPDKPELWISAAKWFLEEQNSFDLARTSFENGLRFNDNSPDLYIEFFRFELVYIEIILKRKNFLLKNENEEPNSIYDFLPESHIENDSIISGKIAMVIFKKAIEKIGLKYLSSFIEILNDFSSYSFSQDLKSEIIKFVKDNYSNKEEAIDFLAKYSSTETNLQKKFKSANEEYQKAINEFSNEKIWSLYLLFILDNIKTCSSKNDEQFFLNKLEEELNNCEQLNLETFLKIIETLSNSKYSNSFFQKIIKFGLNKWDNNLYIWIHYIKTSIQNQGTKIEIKNLFQKVFKILSNQKEDSKEHLESFLQTFLDWAVNNLSERELIKLLETNSVVNSEMKNLSMSRFIASYIKINSLEHISKLNDSQIKLRQFYDKYKMMNPISKDFFLKMISIELRHEKHDLDYIRKLYKDLLSQFNKDDHKIWLGYCKFELEYGCYTNTANIYELAKKQLTPIESDLFIQNYSLLQKSLS